MKAAPPSRLDWDLLSTSQNAMLLRFCVCWDVRPLWRSYMKLAVCLFAGQATLNGQVVTAPTQPGAAQRVTIADLFDRYDVNGNGAIEGSECICEGSKQCDANKDGKISRAEFELGVTQCAGSYENAIGLIRQIGGIEKFYLLAKSGELEKLMNVSLESLFAQWDRNGSGSLEKDECVCKGSKHADTNGDGRVSKEEFANVGKQHFGSIENLIAAVRGRGGAEAFYCEVATGACTVGAVFARYDKNKDGRLESSECICEGSKSADRNRDGYVTKLEFTQGVDKVFGSQKQFEQFVKHNGGAQEFYTALAAGKKFSLPPASN